MQTASILLALGGDSGNQVPKYGVTAAEIAVLRAIHGDDAVTDIRPLRENADRTNRAELARLRGIYGAARDGEGNIVIDRLYPGAAARVFETINELELPEELFAPIQRAKSAPFGGKGDHDSDGKVGGTAKTKATGLDALKVPELRKLAEDKNVDLGDATKKSDIIAKLEAANVTGNTVDAEQALGGLTDEQLAKLASENEVDLEGSTDRDDIIARLEDAGVSAADLNDEIGVLG